MKKISTLLMCLLTLTLASCGSSYNAEKCDELIDNYKEKEKLSSKDIEEALDQMEALIEDLEGPCEKVLKLKKSEDDKAEEIVEESNMEEIATYLYKLKICVERSEPRGDNKKKYNELEKKAEKIGDKIDKISEKFGLNLYSNIFTEVHYNF